MGFGTTGIVLTSDGVIPFQKEVKLFCSEIFVCKNVVPGSELPLRFFSFISTRLSLFETRGSWIENESVQSETLGVYVNNILKYVLKYFL